MPVQRQRQRVASGLWPAALYVLLASVYLIYAPHAEFLLDDWLVLGRYEPVREAGLAEQLRMLPTIVQNRFHNQFRFQFLSFGFAYVLFLVVGYSPKIVFVLFLLLHAACAEALRQALDRLGIGEGVAFLAGALFVLLPSTHGPLFWSHNCSYYLWSTFWFLLYLRALAGGGSWRRQALFLLLALFSGDPIFCLLLAGAPLVAWFLRSKAAARSTLVAWTTVGTAAVAYALFINKAPMMQQGLGLRYQWTLGNLRSNFFAIFGTYRRLTGLGSVTYYQLRPTWPTVAAAVLAGAVTVWYLRGRTAGSRPLSRVLLLAAGLWVAAYGPIWFLKGHELRYDYVASLSIALALAVLVLAAPVARLALAGVVTAWLAVATVADIEQSWIPQSENLRAIGEKLRELKPVEPGDLIIVSHLPMWIGTAPHFAFLAGWASTPYAEHVTGVRRIEAACEIVDEGGKLRVFHYDRMRDLAPQEIARTWVLVQEERGHLGERRLLAQEVHPGGYRLYALKGYTGPRFPPQEFSREQLAMAEGDIYFAHPFSHAKHEH
ncbi:MAG: hypothetical protein HY238_08205 [Acidobacteria bacterium]|nr:hypothetical protein [Acidobacteriota bacterium]